MKANWQCVVPGCGESAPEPAIMCGTHWPLVPAELRQRVEREDANRVADVPGAMLRWTMAARAAVDHVKPLVNADSRGVQRDARRA